MGRLGIKRHDAMGIFEAMPDVPRMRMYRLLFAFHIAAWARHDISDAVLCMEIAAGKVNENDNRVLNCVERVANTIPGIRRFERELEQQMKWTQAFAMSVTALFLDVWRCVYSNIDVEESSQTQNTMAKFAAASGFNIEEYGSKID